MRKNIRIYVDQKIEEGIILLNKKTSHYLKNVMRLSERDNVNIFNEIDGEWLVEINSFKKSETEVLVKKFIKPSCEFFDVSLLFAPIKQARLDYFAQKTCEMGVKTLWPIYTEYTQSKKFNSKRFKANLIEAAEQCDFNNIPEIKEPENLENILTNWDNLLGDNQVIFCDEKSTLNAFDLLQNQKYEGKKWSIIIGPEGGFSENERNLINKKNNSLNISLGPRILRSDTAAVAVLSIFQLIIGDWNN